MALALNAFSFSASTFRFRCRHFLNTPDKENNTVVTTLKKTTFEFKNVSEQSNTPKTNLKFAPCLKSKKARNIDFFRPCTLSVSPFKSTFVSVGPRRQMSITCNSFIGQSRQSGRTRNECVRLLAFSLAEKFGTPTQRWKIIQKL